MKSSVEMAVDLAVRGARVIYVCEHHLEIRDVHLEAERLAAEGLLKSWRGHGSQRIRTKQGGVLYFLAPKSRGSRGISSDAIFAPPSVWGDEALAADLIVSTNGSTFFVGGPVHYSTLQRIRG